jgi:hypothetical protein
MYKEIKKTSAKDLKDEHLTKVTGGVTSFFGLYNIGIGRENHIKSVEKILADEKLTIEEKLEIVRRLLPGVRIEL